MNPDIEYAYVPQPTAGDFWRDSDDAAEARARAQCDRLGWSFVDLQPVTTGLWRHYRYTELTG